jgi:hypothetical protein
MMSISKLNSNLISRKGVRRLEECGEALWLNMLNYNVIVGEGEYLSLVEKGVIMRCELCTRKLGAKEIAHGIRYGTSDEDTDLFLPARESTWTVICSICGEKVYRTIYSKLNPTSIDPTIYKTFTQYR